VTKRGARFNCKDLITFLVMAYNREHLILRAHGHFGSSASNQLDHWSAGLKLAVVGGGPITQTDWSGFLETISTAYTTFHTTAGINAGASCYLDKLTCAPVGLDGKYKSTATPTSERPYTTPPKGQFPSILPWSTANVISLRTLNKRGYASNGRMYWPFTSSGVEPTTGRQTDGAVQAISNAAAVLLTAINNAAQSAQSGLRVHVMSQVGAGTSSLVTEVRSDGRLDGIERRENDQPAVYKSAVVGP